MDERAGSRVAGSRVAMVTGAGSGLGAVVAGRLAAGGFAVLVVDRDVEAAEAVRAGIVRAGGSGAVCEADLSEPSSVEQLVSRVDAAAPEGLGVLVNNAGGWADRSVHYPDSSPEDWELVLRLNLTVPMRLLQGLRPALRAGHGAVVNIASSAGVETTSYGSPEYAIAKAGLVRLTTAVAGLVAEGIRVSCLVPGWIGLPRAHTERAALPESERAAQPALVPPELLAEEVAALVADPDSAGRVVVMLDGTHRRLLAADG